MFTFMQKAVGYISGSIGKSETDNSKCDRPKLEDFLSISCYESKEFEGKITTISEREVVVDNDIYFSVPLYEPNTRFKVGDKVEGKAERQSQYEAWRALHLSLCTKVEKWEDGCSKLSRETIPSKDLDAGIPGILKNDLFPQVGNQQILQEKLPPQPILPPSTDGEIQKTTIGKVKCIHGDTVTLNEATYFSLSSSKSVFNVQQGDWIKCKVSDDTAFKLQQGDYLQGPIEVTDIEPLRKKRIKGEVTAIYAKSLTINNEVFCSRDLAQDLPELRVGDSLITEVIESDQGGFGWRSISLSPVILPDTKVFKTLIAGKLNGISGKATAELFRDKNDIVISNSLRFPQVYLGCKSFITVFIKNVGEQASTLLRISFIHGLQDSPFSVMPDLSSETQDFTPVTILPQKSYSVKIVCKGKFLGQCKQVCIFDFGTFEIGRYLIATVEDKQMNNFISSTVPHRPVEKRLIDNPYPSDRVVRGEKPFKAPPFIPTSMPQYRVPVELWTAVANDKNVSYLVPILKKTITSESFIERFSLLLCLEEIELILQIRKFDIPRTTFSPHGEFLSLSVPGLAEKRPSLMIGDSVIASSPSGIQGPEYEGFIHDVLHTKVLLKFHPSFHELCQDKDFAVQFNFNRTPLRRCHFALNFCMKQLGSEVLFPKKLKYKLPQVVYIDKELIDLKYARTTLAIAAQKGLPNEKSLCRNHGMKLNIGNSLGTVHVNAREDSAIRKKEEFVGKDKVYPVTKDVSSELVLDKKSVHVNYKKPNEFDEHCTDKKSTEYLQNLANGKYQDECSSENIKRVFKKGNSITPPRIPVVTRLFGVPSSGSSANSSICCSDDESRINTDVENDVKCRKKLRKNSEMNFASSMNKSESKSTLNGNSTLSDMAVNVKLTTNYGMNCEVNGSGKEVKDLQLHQCIQALHSQGTGTDKFGETSDRTLHYKVNRSYDNWKPVNNSFDRHIDGPDQVGYNRDFKGVKTLSTINLQDLLKENSGEKYDYCIPILPLMSSVNAKIKDGKVPVLEWFNNKLNVEQKMAVKRILEGSTRPLPYVIYGPPGTGKTLTVVETVLQVFTLVDHSRILIVTPSNSAADLITERLLEFSVLKKSDLVRLNAYQRKEDTIPEHILPYCYNGDQLSMYVRQRVIIATATSAGLMYRLNLRNGHFTHVFVDEAGQLTEPECLVALGLVNSVSGQIVLAGDPQQLGPVVLSRLAKTYGLQESLLHRLCNSVLYQPEEKNNGSSWSYEPRLVTQLLRNYRSHPDIINVSSKLFYHDSLVSGADVEIREKLLKWGELPNSLCPVLFHGIISENLQEGDSPSWFNPTETFQVVRYAKSLTNYGLMPSNIGIITPYRKQVEKIRQLLTIFGVDPGIKVGTVEEFQGQERTAIIISTVRSSENLLEVDMEHSLGFVKCKRRFNVAITRAQSLLIVVGNPLLLSLDNCWLSFISFCISKGAYIGAEIDLDNYNQNEIY